MKSQQVKILYPVDYETALQTGDGCPQTGEDCPDQRQKAVAWRQSAELQAEVSSDEGMAVATRTYDDNYRAITIVNDGSEENRAKIGGGPFRQCLGGHLLHRNRLCTYEIGNRDRCGH